MKTIVPGCVFQKLQDASHAGSRNEVLERPFAALDVARLARKVAMQRPGVVEPKAAFGPGGHVTPSRAPAASRATGRRTARGRPATGNRSDVGYRAQACTQARARWEFLPPHTDTKALVVTPTVHRTSRANILATA
jgi:hypothetical protein